MYCATGTYWEENMNTFNTFCWRASKPKLSKLGFLVLLVSVVGIFVNTTALAQIAGNLSEDSAIAANTTVSIDIRPNFENEYFIANYEQGDLLQFGIGVSSDSYIYVFSIDSDLRYAQVLPNSFDNNNYVYAIQGASYPSYQGNYSFSLESLEGYTTLIALASPRAISEARLERYIKKYLLFAESYSDPAKLANVVIGPDIGIDLSYLNVSGTQAAQSAGNVVPISPSYYQLDYALDHALDTVIAPDTSVVVPTNDYDLANYGEEYSSEIYATAEYQEVLRAYQASIDIYNTYSDEVATSTAQQNNVNTAQAIDTNQTQYRQTITLSGVEPNVEAVTNAVPNSVNDIAIQQPQVTPQLTQSITLVPNEALLDTTLENSVVLSSPIAASTAQPISVVEKSLQSAVNTSPFKSWTALNLKDYRFVFQQFCYCSDDYLYQMIVTVEDNEVSRVQYVENEQDVPDHVFDSIPSIEDIFMGIAEIRVEGLTTVNVVYNQDFSFPNSTYFVNNPETDVDDVSYQISYFEAQ